MPIYEAEVEHVNSTARLKFSTSNAEEAREIARLGFGEKPDGDFDSVDETPCDSTRILELEKVSEDSK